MKSSSVGELEELILRAILHFNNDAYGIEIRNAIEDLANRDLSYGSIYATLERLTFKGWVTGRTGEATAERGGKAKRYFSVTPEGVAALRAAETARTAFRVNLLRVFGGAA